MAKKRTKKEKSVVIDVLRTCVQTYATINGITFYKAMRRITNDTNGKVSYSAMNNWFNGPTISPLYESVAVVIGAMRIGSFYVGARKFTSNVTPLRRKVA